MSSLLPNNATPQEVALDLATARIGNVDVPIRTLWDPENCPADILPWLAWALSIDVWDNSAPVAVKREIVRQSLEVHRRKGTVGAVKRALAATGTPVEIVEWWQDAATVHTFKVDVDVADMISRGKTLSAALISDIQAGVDATKPARAHYTITASHRTRNEVYCGVGSVTAGKAINIPGIAPAPIVTSEAAMGLAFRARAHINTPPMRAAI